MTETTFAVGIDLGGTNVRAALVDGGRIVRSETASSRLGPSVSPAALVVDLVRGVSGGEAVAGIGIAASGPVDAGARLIRNPFTLPDWSDLPWIAEAERRLGAPIAIDNDAMCAALGEFHHGAGRSADAMCMVTLGTGIGVAVVSRGSGPYRGSRGFHPEAGHMRIGPGEERCYCGLTGCWEEQCSGTSLPKHWTAPDGSIRWEDYGRALAMGVANLSRVYAADTFVFGGGVSDDFDRFSSTLRAEFAHPDPMGLPAPPGIVRAELEQAGIIGAAALASI